MRVAVAASSECRVIGWVWGTREENKCSLETRSPLGASAISSRVEAPTRFLKSWLWRDGAQLTEMDLRSGLTGGEWRGFGCARGCGCCPCCSIVFSLSVSAEQCKLLTSVCFLFFFDQRFPKICKTHVGVHANPHLKGALFLNVCACVPVWRHWLSLTVIYSFAAWHLDSESGLERQRLRETVWAPA